MKRDFLTLLSFSARELEHVLQRAAEFKSMVRERRCPALFKGCILGMIFEKSSTRTRVSFEASMYRLGGHAIYLNQQMSQLGRGETYADTARVLSGYADILVLRTFSHEALEELARAATVPVINGLTDLHHPCQLVADLLTLKENGLELSRMKIAYVGDANNMCHSWINASEIFGFDLRIATPAEFATDDRILKAASKLKTITVSDDPRQAVLDADAIYTDTWFSMGQEIADEKRLTFESFQINRGLLTWAKPKALVMHCLPAHRGEEITAEVLDGPQSVVFAQSENRLYAHMAVMEFLLAAK